MEKVDKMDAKAFVRMGYHVEPAMNGGFLVVAGPLWGHSGPHPRDIAAFSNEHDLLSWLSVGHREAA